jgi:hypothetical protein
MAVETDYMGLTPIFKDNQFERCFHIKQTYAQYLLTVCCKQDCFFCRFQWFSWTKKIFVQSY